MINPNEFLKAYRRTNSERRVKSFRPETHPEVWTALYPEIMADVLRIDKSKVQTPPQDLFEGVTNWICARKAYEDLPPKKLKPSKDGPPQTYDRGLHKGLLIMGPTGTGKTALIETLRRFCAHLNNDYGKGSTFKIVSAHEIVKRYAEGGEAALTELRLGNLAIDDLGSGVNAAKHYGTASMPVAELILSRYELFRAKGKVTLATTNYNSEGLREVYGERVSERIFEMMDVWSYAAPSKRYK